MMISNQEMLNITAIDRSTFQRFEVRSNVKTFLQNSNYPISYGLTTHLIRRNYEFLERFSLKLKCTVNETVYK